MISRLNVFSSQGRRNGSRGGLSPCTLEMGGGGGNMSLLILPHAHPPKLPPPLHFCYLFSALGSKIQRVKINDYYDTGYYLIMKAKYKF